MRKILSHLFFSLFCLSLFYAAQANDCYLFTDAINTSGKGFTAFTAAGEVPSGVYEIDTSRLNKYEQLKFSYGFITSLPSQVSAVSPGNTYTEWQMDLKMKDISTYGKPWTEVRDKMEEYFSGFCRQTHDACMGIMNMSPMFHPDGYDNDQTNEKLVQFVYDNRVTINYNAENAEEFEQALKGSTYLRLSVEKSFMGSWLYIHLQFFGAEYP